MSSPDELNTADLRQKSSPDTTVAGEFAVPRKRRWPVTAADIQLYRFCDLATGVLLMAMVVFSPWAFGTSQEWSIWTMTIGSYVTGALLLVKFAIRKLKGYQPASWVSAGLNQGANPTHAGGRRLLDAQLLTKLLLAFTCAILLFTLISALNARATYREADMNFTYHEFIRWLPHSLDSNLTWFHFWQYLGLAFAFWSLVDWLTGKTVAEERVAPERSITAFVSEREGGGRPSAASRRRGEVLPARLRTLLWVLAISGGLMALEGIIQRIEGSGRLLFLVKPRVNPGAETQFGPYAYRSNASQYLNLLWPVILGLWYTLHKNRGRRSRRHHWLLPCTILMAASPIISTSRGGAIVTIVLSFAAVIFLLLSELLLPSRQGTDSTLTGRTRIGLFAFLACTLAIGWALGWSTLSPRLSQIEEGFDQREEMFDRARPMAEDYPWYGTGPGTFKTVFQLYRFSTDTYWPAQLHNDWLETRITFGWVGSLLIAAAFFIVLLRWFAPGGIHGGRRLVILTWMGLAGCLLHARWDLPFQIHSIVFLFLVLCAMLFVLSKRGRTRS